MNAHVARTGLGEATTLDEYQYLNLIEDVLANGARREDRTGVGTVGVFGRQIRFDLARGFPALTTKRLHFKSIVAELLWFLQGKTNIKDLKAIGSESGGGGCRIWDEWADADGELGPVYGKQWRSWAAPDGRSIDQMTRLLEGLRTNPNSRRHIVSAWNPGEVEDMALPPCHCLFQFFVAQGKLSCQLYQRSADIFLGVPFNIASYALLTHMVAQAVGLEPGEFVHTLGDAHLYLNHIEQAELQLTRTPMTPPRLTLAPKTDLFAFTYEDIALEGYTAHPHIKAKVAV